MDYVAATYVVWWLRAAKWYRDGEALCAHSRLIPLQSVLSPPICNLSVFG